MRFQAQDLLILFEWFSGFVRIREAKPQEDMNLSRFCDKVARANPENPKDRRYICNFLRQTPWPGYQPARRDFPWISQI
jgi:hypothetical protein|tara:strand:- start:599 stop:835 length:237 start_codon:yes stop_codon:yes gene_type:complete